MTRKLITILFLILALIVSIFLILRPAIFLGRAYTPRSSPGSLENSYLFASPIQAKADGRQLIRLTIFLLNSQGLGIPDQAVTISTPSPLSPTPIQPQTDPYGKAVFDISSTTPGKFKISASAAGQTLPQSVSVVFY